MKSLFRRPRHTGVSREEILWCYRTFLGRPPESEDVVRLHSRSPDLQHLVDTFVRSEEFLESIRPRITQDDLVWCYRTFFAREPGPEEVAAQAGNSSVREFIGLLVNSPEFRDVGGVFREFRDYLDARRRDAGTQGNGPARSPRAPVPPAEVTGIVASLAAGGAPSARRRSGAAAERRLPDPETATRLVRGTPWHHDFEIIPGLRTNGSYDPRALWATLQLPDDMAGLSVADIGASSGYFSFEAHRRGADVVAFDIRHRDNSGFGLAQYINGMDEIGHHQVNVLNLDATAFGQFDIVLCLGLLYHTSDPYLALRRCADLARGRLLVESHCYDHLITDGSLDPERLMKFWPDPQRCPSLGLVQDRSNFWSPTSTCLQNMVEDMGFSAERVTVNGDRVLIDAARRTASGASTRLGVAYGVLPVQPRGANPDDPAAWTIY